MASIINRPKGHRWIQFTDTDRRRKTIRLGKTSEKRAAEVCRRVEDLLAVKILGSGLDRDLAAWIAGIDGTLRERLSKLGLAPAAVTCSRLGEFLEQYVASRKDLKQSTLTVLGHTRRCLLEFFGPNRTLRDIKPGDADAWRAWLATSANARDKECDELSSNTVNRRTGIARQFFRAAQRLGLIDSNPFASLSAAVRGNRARQYFVTRQEINAALSHAPDYEWRLIIALSRYGGLRMPSELLALTWDDVDLKNEVMTIRASKTERHESSGIRTCPIFPELKPFLEEAKRNTLPDAKYVIVRYRRPNSNLRTQFKRILKRAGITSWPKLFHNMRSTFQTELLSRPDIGSMQDVCDWLGNSPKVALEHYAQLQKENRKRASSIASGEMPKYEPKVEGEAEAKQIPKHHLATLNNMEHQPPVKLPHFFAYAHEKALISHVLQNQGMGGEGLEPATSTL